MSKSPATRPASISKRIYRKLFGKAPKVISKPAAAKPAAVKPAAAKPAAVKPAAVKPAAAKPAAAKPAAVKPVTLAALCAPLVGPDALPKGPERYNAAAQLAVLAPCKSVHDAVRVFQTLHQADLWSLFIVYISRLPDDLRAVPQVRMWEGVGEFRLGQIEAARTTIHRALIAPNGYTVASAALKVMMQNLDAEMLLKQAIAEVDSGHADRHMLLFTLAVLLHNKRFDVLERLVDLPVTISLSENDVFLILLRSRTARVLKQLEKATKLAFRAYELEPDEGFVAIAAIDNARVCPSDDWVEPAIMVGEKFLPKLKNPKLVKQIVVALAGLSIRSNDPDLALARLGALADLDLRLEATTLAIARGFFSIGALDRAHDVLFKQADNVTMVYNMAGILTAQDRAHDAIQLLETAVPETSKDGKYHAIVGHIYAWSGQINLARPCLKKALQMLPDQPEAIADMALCVELDQEYTLALTLMEKASALFVINRMPPIMGLEFMHLPRLRRRMMFIADMIGNETMARALQREAIAKTPIEMPYPVREWVAEPLNGKSVVSLAELGIGDEIRYTSILQRIIDKAASVTLTCDPRLQGLLERSFPSVQVKPVRREFAGIRGPRLDKRKLAVTEPMRKIVTDEVIEQGKGADIWMRGRHYFEAQCLNRSRPFQSPAKAVLKADPNRVAAFAEHLTKHANGRRMVGLSWRGGRRTYNRETHYFQLEQWRPLLDDPGVCFVNLQYAMREDELEFLRATLGERFIELPDLDLFDDMEGIAALCSCLDLVISICTSVLELACAVGCQCLYLMRSPQVTHAIRFSGAPGAQGAYQDAVWHSCRIIPRTGMSDAALIERGRDYMTGYFSTGPAAVTRLTRHRVVKVKNKKRQQRYAKF